MKLSDKHASSTRRSPFYTFEFFPPRTDQGFDNLAARISRLAQLNPFAISITWGAGGSTKDRSLELAELTQGEYAVDTILHLTCTNMEKGMVDEALTTAKSKGIQNILALRGDPPRGQEEWRPIDARFTQGADLVRYIRSSPEYSAHFCVGVAAYPDGHSDHLYDEETEFAHLKQKVDAGADFIITQLFYDVDRFLNWLKKAREYGIKIPIIPGVMPIQTYRSFVRVTKLCGVTVPPFVMSELEAIRHDDSLVKDYGVQLAVNMIRRICAESDTPGIHFCTLNLEKSVQRVLESLQWAGVPHSPHLNAHNKLIAETPGDIVHPPKSTDDSEYLVTPSSATQEATLGLSNIPSTEKETGRGELNNAASWDDFPNGRFGDFKSPAFGDLGPWGSSGISQQQEEVVSQWGRPKSRQDLTTLFLDHLHSKVTTTPFSPTPISPETLLILPHLEKLNRRGWWTVGSQPTVDGTSSSDETFGWGPRAGYVFQKGFIEFFCDLEDVEKVEKAARERGNGWVHWLAGNHKGDFWTNVPENARNAVTWGIFPGQEIVQTTIIERESFLSWKDEAFSIWSDWASFYRPDSEERALLQSVHDERWLLSVIHHDYKDRDALWNFLSSEGFM